jgi:hypothetical protein
MSDEIQVPAASESQTEYPIKWGAHAPRGAKAVLNRIMKEGANVPLFLGQTMINALRDLGYNDTTSAICEHVDNALQGHAGTVRVYFNESGKRGQKKIDVLIVDDGIGMAPHVLQAACSFGGSMSFDDRSDIGRYGMGMKAAALSMSPVFHVYSWQEPGAFYRMIIDTEEIGNDRSNLVVLPAPQFLDKLPSEIVEALVSPMTFPRDPNTQELLARDQDSLRDALGQSGTIIYIPDCDRLTHRKAQTLAEHATKEMARVYRRFLGKGRRILVNNRALAPFDPTYWMDSAWHTRVEGLKEKKSRLFERWDLDIPAEEAQPGATHKITVKMFLLPMEEWQGLTRKVQTNDLRIFDNMGVSFVRNEREVYIGQMTSILGKYWTGNAWWRLEVEFPADLDEAFGVAVNKQGVRPKSYVVDAISRAVGEARSQVRAKIEQHWAVKAAEVTGGRRESERRANETEALQATLLPKPPQPQSEEEKKALEAELRSLAVGLKRASETDDEAYDRIKDSTFVTVFKHDEDAPFYRTDFRLGRVILTINTAHALFDRLYKPLRELAAKQPVRENGDADPEAASVVAVASEALVAFELLLLSLARTQSAVAVNDATGENKRLFDTMRRQWSLDLATQLGAK